MPAASTVYHQNTGQEMEERAVLGGKGLIDIMLWHLDSPESPERR